METVTLPVMTKKVPERKITALTFVNSSDEPLVLDIDEKRGSFAARAEFEGIITSGQIEIYAEDETMVEVSDITVKDNGLINFYLTGKRAGNSELYIATTDGTLVSEPMAFEVRSAEEKAYAERPVYYNMLGDYWHYSKECAEADGPDTAYTWDSEEIPADRFDRPFLKPRGILCSGTQRRARNVQLRKPLSRMENEIWQRKYLSTVRPVPLVCVSMSVWRIAQIWN